MGGGGAARKRDGIVLPFLSSSLLGVARWRCHFFSTAWISSYSREEESHCCRILFRLRVEANFFMVLAGTAAGTGRWARRAREQGSCHRQPSAEQSPSHGSLPPPAMPPQKRANDQTSQKPTPRPATHQRCCRSWAPLRQQGGCPPAGLRLRARRGCHGGGRRRRKQSEEGSAQAPLPRAIPPPHTHNPPSALAPKAEEMAAGGCEPGSSPGTRWASGWQRAVPGGGAVPG